MPDISVNLPDGTSKSVPEGATVLGVAEAIGPRLAQASIAGKLNGALVDVNTTVSDGDTVEIITEKSPDALHILRHSAAHVMAEAVKDLFPMVQFGIGPAIEDGFYYDFAVEKPFTPDDLVAIEERMRQIVSEEKIFKRTEIDRLEAFDEFEQQELKRELISELPEGETISIYRQGAFTDLCRGPHVPDTGRIAAFKLMKVAGRTGAATTAARCSSRIYGTAWFLAKGSRRLPHATEEAEKRDHRKLGKELDLFSFHEIAGAGLPIYHPKGARVLRLMQEWLRGVLYERGTKRRSRRTSTRPTSGRSAGTTISTARTCTSSTSTRATARSTSTPSSR